MIETVAIVGGTGPEGSGLALRFAAAGFSVRVGSRSAERAAAKAAELSVQIGTTPGGGSIQGLSNQEAISTAAMVILCTPFASAAETLGELGRSAPGDAVWVDATVPLRFESGRVSLIPLAEGSGSEHLAKCLPPGARLVAAFKTIPAHMLHDLAEPFDCDLFVCGDDAAARQLVIEAASRLSGLRPLDAGPLVQARTLEHLCWLAVSLNRRYKRKTARFRVVGL